MMDKQINTLSDEFENCLGEIIFNSLNAADENKVAVVDYKTGNEYTFEYLKSTTLNFAHVLKRIGIKRYDTVSIVSENCSNFLIPVISSLYIGSVVSPMNYNSTEGELEHCFKITNPKIIFCSSSTLKKIQNVKHIVTSIENIIVLDGEITEGVLNFNELLKECDNHEISTFTPLHVESEEVCCILFSSGTTGLPKGVMLTDRNMKHNFLTYIRDPNLMSLDENAIPLGILPFYHIFGLLINLGSVIHHAKIVVYSKFQPETFLQAIEKYKINVLYLVPPILIFLAKSPLVLNYDLRSVKNILCGAAPAGKEVEQLVEERINTASVRQLYGMTENGGACTVVSKIEKKKHGTVGKVVTGFEIKVCDLDDKVQQLGAKQVGEICIRGDGVMKGYINNEKATNEIFDCEGFLHTGDIGYFDEDGCVFIVDRLKEIIKYKGFQVPPALLEKVLLKHEAILDVCVVGKPDQRAGELPVAFVVKQPDCTVTEDEIIDYVAERLSLEKHLHGGVRFVDEIPKTPSGKLLRRVLRNQLRLEKT